MMTELERLIDASPRLSVSSKKDYLRTVGEFIRFAGHDSSSWTPRSAQQFYSGLCKRMKTRSANAAFARLRYASRRWAVMGERRSDFAASVETAKVVDSSPPRRSLTVAEARRLLDACRGPRAVDARDFAIVVLLLTSGMRKISLRGIHASDLGLDKKLGYPIVEVTLKGGRRHRVPLAQAAVEALDTWRRWMAHAKIRTGPIFRSITAEDLDGRVRVSGRSISGSGVEHLVRSRAEAAGLDGVFPHLFRHSFATWCQEMSIPEFEIAAITGHTISNSTISKTYTDYSAAGPAAAEAVAQLLLGT